MIARLSMHVSLCLSLALSAALPLRAELPVASAPPTTGSSDGTPGPLRFRRVYAAESDISRWPVGDEAYVPVAPGDFETLVGQFAPGSSAAAALDQPRLDTAHLRARLTGETLLDGDATFRVVAIERQESMLSLGPLGLAIRAARWFSDGPGEGNPRAAAPLPREAANANPLSPQRAARPTAKLGDQANAATRPSAGKEAIVGLAADGYPSVLVAGSGSLTFEWSLRGARDRGQNLRFEVELPACRGATLELDLPRDQRPEIEPGLVFPVTDPAGTVVPDRRQWRIELGPTPRAVLEVVAEDDPRARKALTGVRQSLMYDVSLRGIEVAAEFEINNRYQPLKSVDFLLDRGLQLVAARSGDTSLEWTSSNADGSAGRGVRVTLPGARSEHKQVLRLAAVAPLSIEQLVRLPKIEAPGLSWQEAKVALRVAAPLVLKQADCQGGRQTSATPLASPLAGELFEFEMFEQTAAIEVLLGEQTPRPQMFAATAIELSESEVTGRMSARLEVAEGEVLSLDAEVPEPWTIDSVESMPPEALADWDVIRQPAIQPLLRIQLAAPVSTTRPLALRLVGHRPALDPGDRVVVDELPMIRLQAVRTAQHCLGINAVRPLRLKWDTQGEPKQLDLDALLPEVRKLVAEASAELFFEINPENSEFALTIDSQQPEFSADLHLTATVEAGVLREAYAIRCAPQQSARLTRLLVRFSTARDEPLLWTEGSPDGEPLAARRLAAAGPRDDRQPPPNEIWEVYLGRPRSGAFEIHASRATRFASTLPLSLPAMPAASAQQGSLTLIAGPASSFQIEPRRLQEMPHEVPPSDQYDRVRAVYRYDPVVDADPSSAPALAVTPRAADPLAARLVVWHCQLDSRYFADGTGQHTASLQLQTSDASRLRVRIPDETELIELRIDDIRSRGRLREQWLEVDLPPGRRFPTVSLRYATAATGYWLVASRTAPFPQFESSLPVLSWRWVLWLPPELGLATTQGDWRYGGSGEKGVLHRVLGAFDRPRGEPPFNPLRTADWQQLLPSAATSTAPLDVDDLFARLGTLATKAAHDQPLAWAELLDRLSRWLTESGMTLLIEPGALEEVGLAPQSPVTVAGQSSAMDRARTLLQTSQLALVIAPHVVLLTTTAAAARAQPDLAPVAYAFVSRARPGAFANQISAAASNASLTYISPGRWTTALHPPWQSSALSATDQGDTSGWQSHCLEGPSASRASVQIVRLIPLRALSLAAFIVSATLAWCCLYQRPAAGALALGLLLVAVLFVRPAYVPLASGLFWGALAGLAAAFVWSRSRRTQAAPTIAELGDRGLQELSVGLLCLVLVGLSPGKSSAAEGTAATALPAQGRDEAYRVFIPVDNERKPTGGAYQVPQQLFRDLRDLAAQTERRPRGWLLSGALYRGELAWDPKREQLVCETIDASYELRVFQLETNVGIPFGSADTATQIERVRLDGRVLSATYDKDRSQLMFRVPAAGVYRLELGLRVAVAQVGEQAGFDLSVPAVPGARLELNIPPEAPAIDVPTALGKVERDEGERTVEADLGAADRLAVRWGSRNGLGSRPPCDVEELVWLKVQPGAVVMHARYKILRSAKQQTFRVAADSALRLLPPKGSSTTAPEVQTDGDSQVFLFRLGDQDGGPAEINLSLLMSDRSGVGNIRLPHLAPLDASLVRRLFALSVAPALTFAESNSEGLQPVAVAEFLAAWGVADGKPDQAYERTGNEPDWSLSTRPAALQLAAEPVLTLTYGCRRAKVHFEARLAVSNGSILQHRLDVPSELEIESIAVQSGQAERPARWFQDTLGHVTVFATDSLAAEHTVLLRGSLAVAENVELPIPAIRIADAHVQSSELRVFRETAAQVGVSIAGDAVTLAEPIPGRPKHGPERLVGRYRSASGHVDGSVVLKANNPRLEVQQITSLTRKRGQWEADVECRLRVEEGLVDALTLEVPDEWSGPFKLEPAAEAELVAAEAGGIRRLTIRPSKPIEDTARFVIRGRLTAAAGRALAVPRIAVQGAQRLGRLLVLPMEMDGQPLQWNLRGVRSVAWPFAKEEMPRLGGPSTTYEVRRDDFAVSLHGPGASRESRQVRLADVAVRWHGDGELTGAATFDIEPGGVDRCPFWLPDHYELLALFVEGRPAETSPVATNRWQVALHSDRLPQRIEVLFRGRARPAARTSEKVRIEAPRLGALPVERTVWRLYEPLTVAALPSQDVPATTPLQFELVRATSTSGIVEAVADAIADQTADEIAIAFRPWAERMWKVQQALRRQLAGSRRNADAVAGVEAAAIDDEQRRLAARLGVADVLEEIRRRPVTEDQVGELLDFTSGRPEPGRVCVFQGMRDSLDVGVRDLAAIDFQWRARIATVVLLLCCVAAYWLRRDAIGLRRFWRPALLGAVFGLLWWLYLAPSAIGLAILFFCLVAGARRGWRRGHLALVK